MWKPAHWADVIQPVADFLRISLQRYRCDKPETLAESLVLLETLAAAAEAFEPDGAAPKSAAYSKVMSTVSSLQECVFPVSKTL